jgi:uncharacterized protein YciI
MSDASHLYLVVVVRTPAFKASAGDAHQAFLAEVIANGQLEMTGPFTDGSGGAYLLRAPDLAAATAIAHRDPLHTSGSSTLTVHEWRVRRFAPEA